MIETLRTALAGDPRIAFAVLFGSTARGTAHGFSDVDVAISLMRPRAFDSPAFGDLVSLLESVTARTVHLVVLDDAPPGLAYRVFRDGTPILINDRRRYADRLARAILEYLDFKPIEEVFTRGVLQSRRGR